MYPQLETNLTTDVTIIGGNVAGITTALLLQEAGLKVVVLIPQTLQTSLSSYSIGHLSLAQGCTYRELQSNFDESIISLYAKANSQALQTIAHLIKTHHIDCNFQRVPEYVYLEQDEDQTNLIEEFKIAKQQALPVSLVPTTPLPFKTGSALKYQNQAQLDAAQYVEALAKVTTQKGTLIFENTPVLEVTKDSPYLVTTSRGVCKTKKIILASPLPALHKRWFSANLKTIRSYTLTAELKDRFTPSLFSQCDTDKYRFRLFNRNSKTFIQIKGESHRLTKKTSEAIRFKKLEFFVRSNFKVSKIVERKLSQEQQTADEIPYVGRFDKKNADIFIATGFESKVTMQSTIAALILKDLITKGHHPWEKIYDPNRFNTVQTAFSLLNKGSQKAVDFINDWLKSRKV